MRKILDWIAIPVGMCAMFLAFVRPESSCMEVIYKALMLLSAALGLLYLMMALFLWFFRRVDFDWYLVHGDFLRKIICLVLLLPFTLTVFVGLAGILPVELFGTAEDEAVVNSNNDSSLLWIIYYNFIDPGNQHMSTTPAGRVLVGVIAMLGVFLMNGLLVSSMVGWIDNRKEMWNKGQVRFKLRHLGKYRFAIVIGANEIAPSVIRDLFTKKEQGDLNFKCEGDNRYVILQTEKDAEKVREELSSYLSEEHLKRVVIYNALRDSSGEIERLYPEYATEIYVLGESVMSDKGDKFHDAMNMKCVNVISDHLEKTRARRIADKAKNNIPVRKVCKVMFEYQTTSSVFNFSDIPDRVKDNIVFIPFNRYDSWARKVIVEGECTYGNRKITYSHLEGDGMTQDSLDFVHVIIVGMSKMGVSLAVQTLLQAHYLNFEKARTRITFIDAEADKEMDFFKGRYSNLFELMRHRYIDADAGHVYSRVKWTEMDPKWHHLTEDKRNFLDVEMEFIKGAVESDGVRNYLIRMSNDKHAKITIAVCLPQTHQAIAAGLYMPLEVYRNERLQQILIYQRESADIVLNLSDNPSHNLRYKKLKPFGMIHGEYMSDRTLYLKAMLVNVAYDITNGYNGITWTGDIADSSSENMKKIRASWKNLPVSKKWSNKYFVDSIGGKLRASGGKLKEYEEPLAKLEHNRWNVEQLIHGYSPCDEELDSLFKRKEQKQDISKDYSMWKMKNLGTGEYVGKEKEDVKKSELRIHPNICSYGHLAEVDYGAYKYDKDLNYAIARIISLVDRREPGVRRFRYKSRSGTYCPSPMDTSDVELSAVLDPLMESVARNVHEVWARSRMDEGWKFGRKRNDRKKTHPCLVPYEELPEIEKDYDRNTAKSTLKLIVKLGFRITKN